ncbi:MAG TPA: shikimate kinase [Candidatus Omnitrophota bacterium]|nr:shikimate kinase [Candidatus Omnitrophota bacterium]
MNIILIGFMGVGKSEVGRALAARLNLNFIDTDAVIEKSEGRSISSIFEKEGEPRFRDIETEVVRTLEDYDGFVISTGGGMVLKDENVKMLKAIGPLVLLNSRPDVIHDRLQDNDDRPLLKRGDKLENITGLLAKREPFYAGAADFTVDTSDITPQEAAEEIIKWLKK